MSIHDTLTQYLQQSIENIYNISLSEVILSLPPKKNMWDFAFWCFPLAKQLKKSPIQIASELEQQIIGGESIIQSCQADGPYVNIYISPSVYEKQFLETLQWDRLFWELLSDSSQTIYIDYIGANVWKPLHIGHMCTPSQWQVFINTFQRLGYNVISDSHIGDWGIIFWKLIVAFEKYGSEEKLAENAVDHLFELYVKISTDCESNPDLEQKFRNAFKKLSRGKQEMKDIWSKFTKESISAMNILLSRLFVYPKYNIWESFYEWLWLEKMEDYPDLKYSMKDIVGELLEKNIATKNEDGSVWVVFSDEMKIPSCILQKRDGTHGYLASDLASVKYRIDNWNPQKILYFVDVRQQLHLKQTFVISRLAGWLGKDTEITHAHNGFISLKEGAMSTRKWKIIKLQDLLYQSEEKAKNIILEKRADIQEDELEKLSKTVWVAAIKYWYLKKSREMDVIFDWDEFMSFEWNSAPYIQYAYVRAKTILDNYGGEIARNSVTFETESDKNLAKAILWFENAVSNMLESYHPHILCQYVYDLTKAFSVFYNNVSILKEDSSDIKNSRLLLLSGFMRVIDESFSLLGIPLPDKM